MMPSADEILRAQMVPRRSTIDALMPNSDPSLYRKDGSKKAQGFFGPLRSKDGRTSTEISIGVNFDGKEQEIPSLVPTLTPAEVRHMLAGNAPTNAIIDKAVEHARRRALIGRNPFRQEGEGWE